MVSSAGRGWDGRRCMHGGLLGGCPTHMLKVFVT